MTSCKGVPCALPTPNAAWGKMGELGKLMRAEYAHILRAFSLPFLCPSRKYAVK